MKQFDSIYILAGGQSSRFGESKALVSILGEPLIVRLASQLASESFGVTLVVQKLSDYSAYGIPAIEDGVSTAGPLAGVLAALRASSQLGNEWCLISSCDILNWRKEWIPVLSSAIEFNPKAMAAFFLGDEPGGFRPFPGLYRSSLMETVEQLWREGVRSMREFHRRLDGKVEKCHLESDLLPKTFNTRAELRHLLSEND